MTKKREHSALATCPWCPWSTEIFGPTMEAVLSEGGKAIAAHNLEAGHPIKEGREPRQGYYKGDPIS